MNVAATAAPGASTSAPPASVDDSALSAERPFPGLRPFGVADREFFFGRERQTFALYRLVENGRFIAVIGSSGSGKSSLVLAGLRGLLADESADPGGPTWACLDMRPGGAPIARLAKTLARLAENDSPDEAARRSDRIEYRLRQSSFSFENALEEADGLRGRSLLLIVDQFEELFRFGLAGLGLRRAGVEETRARDEATQFVQILLDADRRRLKDVRALITMRSDFIGDCAYFHGLSEAVSATQYLVPGLTRSQLEDAILKPIEKAGATIEPELVERLINDCGDELDQLPVLQHCLMRLWDRASAASGTGARLLTRQTYDDIGRMAEVLSRHADEILRQCAGKELAVEQAFRALSELDREGRAIRRALPFKKLLAETGVSEGDLRAVLDSFRAPTCSFLVPPPSVAPVLAADDRVDIGHETLLRRWRQLAGETEKVEASTGRPAAGWIQEEQKDGQQYRTLVSLLEDNTGGDVSILAEPERKKQWWGSLPRTPAWADRYGGKFDDVKKLIDDSIAAKQREREAERLAKRKRLVGWAGTAACVALAATLFGWQAYESSWRQQEAIDKSAMKSAKTLLEQVLQAYDDQNLDLAGAESLATISRNFLDDVRASHKTSAADLLWGEALDVEADLKATLSKDAEALALSRQAKGAALSLTQSNPKAQEPLQLLYDATIRVGNALAAQKTGGAQGTLDEYRAAIDAAQKIVSLKDSETAEDDLIDAHLKIGDIKKDDKQYADALTEYSAGLSTCEAALAKDPQSFNLLRNRGKAFFRLAELFRVQDKFDEAGKYYQQALEVQKTLASRNEQDALVSPKARDLSLISNLATTDTHWGLLERKAGDLKLALSKFQEGAKLDEELARREPGNPNFQEYLARNYSYIADILEQLKRPDDALIYYQKLFETRRTLAFRGLGPPEAREKFAEAAKLFGDRSNGLAQIDAYRSAVRTWKRLIESPTVPNTAAEKFDDVMRFARAFEAQNDWPDAQTAYGVAAQIAVLNLADNPSDASWREKADAAGKASVEAANAIQTAPASAPQPP
jgi:tetratricopeptide (TPR) repeat protein/energy-coupling factor transporter ATP-binding protein EcfA2